MFGDGRSEERIGRCGGCTFLYVGNKGCMREIGLLASLRWAGSSFGSCLAGVVCLPSLYFKSHLAAVRSPPSILPRVSVVAGPGDIFLFAAPLPLHFDRYSP